MWKPVIKKHKNGRDDDISYRLKCDICGKLFTQHGEVVKFSMIQDLDTPEFCGWFVMGDGALCPDCRSNDDDKEMVDYNIVSFSTWCKNNNVKKNICIDKNGYKTWVWPTLKEHGFKKYNSEPNDIYYESDTPKTVAIRAIDRGGSPRKGLSLEDIEFVYAKLEYRYDECVGVFWRKKNKNVHESHFVYECVKCGKKGKASSQFLEWDFSGSSHRFICKECGKEEGIE